MTVAQRSRPEKLGPLRGADVDQLTGIVGGRNVQVPLTGKWQLQVDVMTDPITEIDGPSTFTI